MAKILRKCQDSTFPKLSLFLGQKSILRQYYIQNVEDGIKIRVYSRKKESVAHVSHLISVKVRRMLKKS